MQRGIGWRSGFLLACLLMLTACGGADSDRIQVAARPQLPPADYLTQSDQFAELQRAALAADYRAFAQALHAGDPQAVVAQLTDAFAGKPFDAYTLEAHTGSREHQRVAELRGDSARLYLYLELDRSPGGWNVGHYALGRDRDEAMRRL